MSSTSPSGEALITTSLPETDTFKFVSRGKVRDLYDIKDSEKGGEEYLLFVSTDRISAFDVILKNGVPGKGALLTQMSVFWFKRLAHVIPNHLIASTLEEMPPGIRKQLEPHWKNVLEGRTLLVRKAKVVQMESIVRGYLTGSAWAEYKKGGTVHGIPMPEGLVESEKLSEPMFTPSTKSLPGDHDENITPQQAKEMIGEELYGHISRAALALFKEASEYALSKGLIIADTKFEFGLLPLPPSSNVSPTITIDSVPYQLILVDEVLTPDSSRYWTAHAYTVGFPQASLDKQYLRYWLLRSSYRKGLESGPRGSEDEGWKMTPEVIEGTIKRYREVVRMLIG